MGVSLRAKFEVSRIILTSFRQGGNFTPSPTSKEAPKKPTQIRVKTKATAKIKKYLLRRCAFFSAYFYHRHVCYLLHPWVFMIYSLYNF